jgi:DNA-binding HxlR family transcriptional regulator
MVSVMSSIPKTQGGASFIGFLKSLDAKCLTCSPITPLECLTRCKVYKLKNELRVLRESMMNNSDYIKELFNVLKNGTRLQILHSIVNGKNSMSDLQQELTKVGHTHSQSALTKDYLEPLVKLGIIGESREKYCLTSFGSRLTKLLGCFPEFAPKLPARSECYEETLLQYLLLGPKTFEEIELVVSPKNVSRTLNRLHSARLIKTPPQREYVFFFKTIRTPEKEILRTSERRIYNAIASCDGISAGPLAEQTGYSIRVIYRCVRHLKGKKLMFIRRKPKTYHLTCKGEKLASVIRLIQQAVEDTWLSFQQTAQNNEATTNKIAF